MKGKKKLIFTLAAVTTVVILIAAITILIMKSVNKSAENGNTVSDSATEENEEDPQQSDGKAGLMGSIAEEGVETGTDQILSASSVAENNQQTFGIDVSKYQGTIRWDEVAAGGIDFAMIRVGYRTQKTGEMCVDANAKYNMQEAQKNGIKIGVYFFSAAINEAEAVEEADWVADYISKYQITYPVAFDCEGFTDSTSRQYGMSADARTKVAEAFLQEIYEKGYTPMFYAAMNELSGNSQWNTKNLESKYKIWVSQYPQTAYPDTPQSSYEGTHAMWQYTNNGRIAGIDKNVDLNVAYFGYEDVQAAKNGDATEIVSTDPEANMKFTDVNETVTAKESVNLRDIPSQGSGSTIKATLNNGDTATRTGISDSGWSRVEYNGQTYYAISNYLTTDMNYVVPGQSSGDGLRTKFTDCNDTVTAKIEVNLRSLPSVTNPDATVVATIKNGETVTRTGINEEYGWSRVEYNGQTLYCVTSYLLVQ
ncbi:GH25 family lysozyme [Agathobacter sp.]